ncbi:hypothetical protein [Vitiosangium sp. GDMCC 1.1324]|uniref:hypothetical protein n=1 Tax=Vitiosangium sp. (strain GDMCC 1.1324) TaxID=2138576 RepID=UPI0011B3811B|nr:hypothetical protein [Vitiosangium sp. GDMCC 1.1324]
MGGNLGRLVVLTLWILLLLTPVVARAANEGTIQQAIAEISRLYEDLDYEHALEQIHMTQKRSHQTLDDIALSLYEGIVLCEMGKQAEAIEAFKFALYMDSTAKLPVQVSPKIEAMFESVRQDVVSEIRRFDSQSGERPPIDIKKAYENSNYERVLDEIRIARQMPLENNENVQLFLYEGVALYNLRKEEQGKAAFKSALELRPDARLPGEVAPKIKNAFEAVRRMVKQEMSDANRQAQVEQSLTPDEDRTAQEPPSTISEASPPPGSPEAKRPLLSSGMPGWAWAPGAGGVALLGLGTFFYIQAGREYKLLTTKQFSDAQEPKELLSSGRRAQAASLICFGLGAAGLVTTEAIYLLSNNSRTVPTVRPTAALSPMGGMVGLVGALP